MNKRKIILFLLIISFFLSACNSSGESETKSASVAKETQEIKDYKPGVLEPVATGKEVIGQSPVTIDISNKTQGYMIASYSGSANNALVQVTGVDAVDYRYYIKSKEQAVIPFICGSGSYTVAVYENVQDTEYGFLWTETLEISLDDEVLPFLYPNQYVNFNKKSKAVKKASQLDVDKKDTLETIQTIYNYVIKNITYDYDKAENVQSGYLPVVDETLKTKTGICFDYAALMTAMLRSRGIPSKLVIGYTGDIYHAWISVYTKEKGWIDKVIQFDGNKWRMMDPTFASSADDEDTLNYISDETNYTEKYVH